MLQPVRGESYEPGFQMDARANAMTLTKPRLAAATVLCDFVIYNGS